jgi:hypothetical protein
MFVYFGNTHENRLDMTSMLVWAPIRIWPGKNSGKPFISVIFISNQAFIYGHMNMWDTNFTSYNRITVLKAAVENAQFFLYSLTSFSSSFVVFIVFIVFIVLSGWFIIILPYASPKSFCWCPVHSSEFLSVVRIRKHHGYTDHKGFISISGP